MSLPLTTCPNCCAVSVNMDDGSTIPALRQVAAGCTQCRACGERRVWLAGRSEPVARGGAAV